MGFRSSICQFGKRLLAALIDPQTIYKQSRSHYTYTYTYAPAHAYTHSPTRAHAHACRVCAVQQAATMSENLVCNSHRINQLTSRPLPPLPTARALPALPEIPRPPMPSTPYDAHQHQYSRRLRDSCLGIDADHDKPVSQSNQPASTASSPAATQGAQGDMRRHNHSLARFVVALQAALQNVRYAISGPLALRLFDPMWYLDVGEPLDGSCSALQPSIVCPLATRDVLPSWAAASQNAFRFDRRRPNSLQLHIDGRFVTVHIKWVDDHKFDSGKDSFCQIDRSEGAYYFSSEHSNCGDPYEKLNLLDMAPPVLSLRSLLQHTAQAYTRSGNSGENTMEHKVLGQQVDACLRLLDRSTTFGGQFLMPHEVPAVYDPAFSSMYYAEFGAEGVQRLHAVCGGIPSLGAPETCTSSTHTSPKHIIPRKPLASGSRHQGPPPVPEKGTVDCRGL